MTDEQFELWIQTDEGRLWVQEELKKKLLEYEKIKKISQRIVTKRL